MHSKLVFLFLELVLHGNYCSQQQAIIFPLLPFYLISTSFEFTDELSDCNEFIA